MVDVAPIFVSRAALAARLDISVDTFDVWLREGFIPPPDIEKGQIRRWHWPTVEATLAKPRGDAADPYMTGVLRRA